MVKRFLRYLIYIGYKKKDAVGLFSVSYISYTALRGNMTV